MKSFFVTFLFMLVGVESFPVVVPFRTQLAATPSARAVVDPVLTDDDETAYDSLLKQAHQYAYSESTTPSEAKMYLRYILELQSDCVSGNVVGNICDNVTELVDIVAHLRQKATQQQAIMASSKEILMLTTIVTAITVSSIITNIPTGSPDVVPFTMEEWRWAIRDGYLNTMISHYLRNGGL